MSANDNSLQDDFMWEVVPRQGRHHTSDVFISLRRNSMKMSRKMYESLDAERYGYTHVIIRRDNAKLALLLQFVAKPFIEKLDINHPFHDALYELLPDGGKRPDGRDGRKYSLMNCGNIVTKTPWLFSIVTDRKTWSRRFAPEPQKARGQYIVRFVPGFAESASVGNLKIDTTLKGIYCLLGQGGNVLYIGRGFIAKRLKSHLRLHNMPAHTIKYTVMSDDKTIRMAEAHHLAGFRAKHGLLPQYNSILSTGAGGDADQENV